MDERVRQKEMVKRQLIAQLEDVAEYCNMVVSRLKKNNDPTLGGHLQTVWDIFYKLGELNILSADYLFSDKK